LKQILLFFIFDGLLKMNIGYLLFVKVKQSYNIELILLVFHIYFVKDLHYLNFI